MRLERLSLENIGPFKARVDIDLRHISGVLVALTGLNGEGKTCLLEAALPGAMYRSTPTRGSLQSQATSRSSFVEARVVNGAAYTIRQTVDQNGGGTSSVTDEQGRPCLSSTSVREFDKWAAAHLPSPEVLYASIYGAQSGKGGFLELSESERKAVILRALGIEKYEALAEHCRRRVGESRGQLQTLLVRIKDEEARSLDVPTADQQLGQAVLAARDADARLAVAEQALADASVKAPDLAARRELRMQKHRKAVLLTKECEELASQIADLRLRVANNTAILADRDSIEAAAARMLALGLELGEARTTAAAVETDLIQASSSAREAAGKLASAQARMSEARDRIFKMTPRVRDKDAVMAAVARLPELEGNLAVEETIERQHTADLKEARLLELDVAGRRVGVLRPALETISEGGKNHPLDCDLATDALYGDDQIVLAAEGAKGRVPVLEQALQRSADSVGAARRAVDGARFLAARAEPIAEAERDLADAEAAFAAASVDGAVAQEAVTSAAAAVVMAEGRRAAVAAELTALQAEAESLQALAARKSKLDVAEGRVAELAPQIASAEARTAELTAEIARLMGEGDAVPDPKDVLEAASWAHEQATRDARAALGLVAVAEARLASAKAGAERLTELHRARTEVETDLSDWVLLADSLGRDGLQALEIDCAGPELTELTNDLLRSCFGPRWSASWMTTRLNDKGRQLEDCDVRVVDSENGREGSADTLSGGEKVVVGEACSLALAMLVCRRSGLSDVTLVRDESGAALDSVNAKRYIAMLRRAAAIIGASKVLFVSHSPEVQALADARIVVANGTATVAA